MDFYKYQGTGNDFVMIDNRAKRYLTRADVEKIERLCDRKFGIGADGLILLENHADYDFEMIYFNADGRESSMCGNGGRCIVAFANFLGAIQKDTRFIAIDGVHDACIEDGNVELKMSDVASVEIGEDYFLLNTGSPHYVIFVEDIDDINVFELGRTIRYSNRFRVEGVNVNFVEIVENGIKVATYERGVEDETLSCGTGVTAAAIAYYLKFPNANNQKVAIESKGGALSVKFEAKENNQFENIWLCGNAQQVFQGKINV